MPLGNTSTRYGTVAKTLHWLTALLIVTLIPLGIVANGMPFETPEQLAEKARLFSLHKTLGVTLFFVALLRIVWALTQPKPSAIHAGRRGEVFLANTVHWLLYGSLMLVPLSGWVTHAATEGFAPILWPLGQSLPFVPKSEELAGIAAGLHIVFERVLVIALFLHVLGALKHHFIDRDITLRRMWFGQAEGGSNAPHPSPLLPVGAALAAWAIAIGVGMSVGVFKKDVSTGTSPELAAVTSEWQVESGTLAITVNQLGSDVTGQFGDWTAAITFDETAKGAMGDVDVTVSIPSLTLGSVTTEALKPEYFDAGAHPTASFVAEISRVDDGFVASGTLTIKGNAVPVEMPFDLALDGNRAQMSGGLMVDRRDFGIGPESESSVKHPVKISVELVATR